MTSQERTAEQEIIAVWCGPIFAVLTIVGWLGIAHFWAPAPADLSPAEMARFFTQTYREGILLGCSIYLFSCCFLIVWAAETGVMTWRIEGAAPVWTIVQVIGGAGIAIVVILDCSFWISAAYRPAASPDIVVAMNDAAWMGFLLGWPLLSMEMIANAMAALSDSRPTPLFPHWLSKASLAGAVLLVTAAGPAFTQKGPFAYHGVLGFYVPMLIWGSWMLSHSWYMRKALRAEQPARTLAALATAPTSRSSRSTARR
jgi:hypothetical protein